jgi:NADH:ubiquinone oxidoreductase subunit 6 (subunit J)
VIWLRGFLIFVGAVLIVLSLVVMALGLVEVAQGEKGTWGIWPYYLIHGGIALVAVVLFAAANRGREKPAAAAAGGEGES